MTTSDCQIPPQKARVLVGESVYENAVVTVNDGVLWIEFEADDLDSIAVDLTQINAR